MQNLKNNEPRPKFTGSYKKKAFIQGRNQTQNLGGGGIFCCCKNKITEVDFLQFYGN